MWKLFGVTTVKNGKNYCENESNLFFDQHFVYLKIYIIIFKYLSICKIEALIFFLYFINENYWRRKKILLSLLFLDLTLLQNSSANMHIVINSYIFY